MDDGDLWELFFRAASHKGPQAIRVGKVKGHATADDVSSGIATNWTQEGNNAEDALATKAFEQSEGGLASIACFFKGRHAQYVKFLQHVHDIIISVLLAVRSARDNKDKGLIGMLTTPVTPEHKPVARNIGYAVAGEGLAVTLLPLDFSNIHMHDMRVLAFVCVQRLELPPNDRQGITWLESLLSFSCMEAVLPT